MGFLLFDRGDHSTPLVPSVQRTLPNGQFHQSDTGHVEGE